MRGVVQVLLVEDSEDDAALIERELRRLGPIATPRVEDEAQMREVLAAQTIDLIVSDWSLPRFSGARALGVARELAPDVPFIIVSGDLGEEVAVSAMRAGASDYVLKDRLKRLVPVVERELREAKERGARRRAEEQLRLQDLRFRALLEHSGDVITLKTHGDRFAYISPAVTAVLGYRPEELIGKLCLDVVHPDDRARVAAFNVDLHAAPERPMICEYRAMHHDGSPRWLEATETNRLADPAVAGIIGNVRDITERKQAFELVQASELKYRRIVETTSEGVVLTDRDGRFAFANGRMAGIVGYEPAELIGKTVIELVEPAGRAELALRFEERKRGIAGFAASAFIHKDGSVRQVVVESTPIFNDTGEYEGVLAMIADVSARRAAEAALRASENRFARLAEIAVIGIANVGLDGTIRDANETLCRMCGYSPHEMIDGFNWIRLVPAELRAQALENAARIRKDGVIEPFEREIVRKDGSRFPALVGAATVDGTNGIMFVVDLSAQKRAETELAVIEQQLRHAQKMEAMGRLAGGVAHDFNNVLSVILSYAEMLIEDLEPGGTRDDLVEIRNAAQRAAEVTEQLLLFGRKHAICTTLVEPAQVVHDLERMLRRLLGEDVALEISAAAETPRILIDKGQLDQVVINLAINARDAMPRGGTLTIALSPIHLDADFAASHHGVVPGEHARIVVADTGTGIEPTTLARIFEPFFTTKEVGKGTGLGLATVFGIIQRAGGSIWVDSKVGKGTEFTIYLPRSEDDGSPTEAAPVVSDLGGTETILLAEDDPQVRLVAAGILRRAGYKVLIAESPVDAIRIAHEHAGMIHLLVSDVVMPQISGTELAHRVALLRPGIAVLHMSGYTDETAERHGVTKGEANFLQKPLTPDTLRSKVRQALATRGIVRPA